jgi:hypothetical protein
VENDMADRLTERLAKMAGPLLAPGETPEQTLLVQIGQISAKRKIAAVAVGTAAAVALGAAGGFVGVSTRPDYVLVTDRRLLVFSYAMITPMGRHRFTIDRAAITSAALRRAGVQLKLRLDLADGQAVEFGCKPLPPKYKRRLRAFGESLGAVQNAAA